VLSGRRLRACAPARKGASGRTPSCSSSLRRCHQGSRRSRRRSQRTAQVSAHLSRPQRAILHQAARQAVDFCQAEGVTRLAVGEVRHIQTGVSLSRVSNHKISQWPLGVVGEGTHPQCPAARDPRRGDR